MAKFSNDEITRGMAQDQSLYDREYYLKELPEAEDYRSSEGRVLREKHDRSLAFGGVKVGEKILDVGCGRGELSYHCALRGCHVVGIDFSEDALPLCQETIAQLPKELQGHVRLIRMDARKIALRGKFDLIFLIDITEHLYDDQLREIFEELKRLLSTTGRILIQTPNWNYENILYPAKRIASKPFTILKQIGRILRGKKKEKTWREWCSNTFKIRYPQSCHSVLHINVKTPRTLKKLLMECGFEPEVFCHDHSKNPVSLLLQKNFGREIIAIARCKR